MNPTRRNLLASGMLVLGGASPVLASAGGSETHRRRDPFAQLADQRAVEQDNSIDYIDIRHYGTVVEGGNITAALQRAMDAYPMHKQNRIRIPKTPGNVGTYTLDTINFWDKATAPWIIEFDCALVRVTDTLRPANNVVLRGVTHSRDATYLSQPFPRPWLKGVPKTLNPVIDIRSGNVLIENLAISDCTTALRVQGTNLVTLRNCLFGSNGAGPPLKLEMCFWITLENIWCEPRAAGDQYAIEFTTDVVPKRSGTDTGLIRAKEIRVSRNGILFRSHYGPVGVRNIEIIDLISENQLDGTSLITFDSSHNNVGEIKIIRPAIADERGTCYLLKNIGDRTNAIYVQGSNQRYLLDPTSDPIKNLVIDNTVAGTINATSQDLTPIYGGTSMWGHWRRETPSSIDARLLTAPIGLPWVYGTPLDVVQDPAGWIQRTSGATIIPGILAPDGSTMAGRVGGGGGAVCYNGTHTLAVGDWILAGVWMRVASGTLADRSARIAVEPFQAFILNNTRSGWHKFSQYVEDFAMGPIGWRWACAPLKVTTVGTNPATIKFFLSDNGYNCDYFNPCAILIPASAGIDDAWMVNIARSLKGGWPSNAEAGTVALLNHQKLQVAGGARVYSAATAPTGAARKGDVCWNSAPAVGQPKGWQCTVSGNPGTWVSMGNL